MEFIAHMKRCREAAGRSAPQSKNADPTTELNDKARDRRRDDRQNNRARQREMRFCANRELEPPPLDESEPEPLPRLTPGEQLRLKLKEWQVEREKQKKRKPRPPPPFKACCAPSELPPAPPPVTRRQTRSCKKANLIINNSSIAPLAPIGTTFRPPVIRKATPKKLNSICKPPTNPNVFSRALFFKSKLNKMSVKRKSLTPRRPRRQCTMKSKIASNGTTNPKNQELGMKFPLAVQSSDEKSNDAISKSEVDFKTSTTKHNISLKIESPKSVSKTPTKIEKTPESQSVTKLNSSITPKTPNSVNSDIVIHSPFVSVLRGKHSMVDHRKSVVEVSPEKSAQFFRIQLDEEISRLSTMCDEWNLYKKNNKNLIEEHVDMIDVAVGQTQLLINKKFQQFRGLIEKCERNDSEGGKMVKVQDLRGFWDMIYMQVENLDIRFNEIVELRARNWKEKIPTPKSKTRKDNKTNKFGNAKSRGPSASLKATIQAARSKRKQDTNLLTVNTNNDNVINFDGVFFSVTSPVKSPREVKTNSNRDSLHRAVLTTERSRRISTLNMSAVLTASSKSKTVCNNTDSPTDINEPMKPIDLNKTPGKSILKSASKSDVKSQTKGKNIRVLFDDNDINEEQLTRTKNDEIVDGDKDEISKMTDDLESDSASKKSKSNRRSRRLSKYKDENSPLIDSSDLTEDTTKIVKVPKRRNSRRKLQDLMSPFKVDDHKDVILPSHESSEKKKNDKSPSKNFKQLQNIIRNSIDLISFDSPIHTGYNTRNALKKG